MGAKPFNWDEWEHTPDMVADWLEGMPCNKLAAKYNKSAMTIHRYLKSLELNPLHKSTNKPRTRKRSYKLNDQQIKEICYAYVYGAKKSHLAKKYGVSPGAIKKYLDRFHAGL